MIFWHTAMDLYLSGFIHSIKATLIVHAALLVSSEMKAKDRRGFWGPGCSKFWRQQLYDCFIGGKEKCLSLLLFWLFIVVPFYQKSSSNLCWNDICRSHSAASCSNLVQLHQLASKMKISRAVTYPTGKKHNSFSIWNVVVCCLYPLHLILSLCTFWR